MLLTRPTDDAGEFFIVQHVGVPGGLADRAAAVMTKSLP